MADQEKSMLLKGISIVSWIAAGIIAYRFILSLTTDLVMSRPMEISAVVASIVLVLIGMKSRGISLSYDNRDSVRRAWGKADTKKRDMKAIKKTFGFINKVRGYDGYITEQTAMDLKVDQLFERVDRNNSILGEVQLYRLFRTPLMNKEGIEKRNEKIEWFTNNKDIRENVEVEFYKIGRGRERLFPQFLFDKNYEEVTSSMKFYSFILSKIWVFPLVVMAFNPYVGASSFLLVGGINFVYTKYLGLKLEDKSANMDRLGRMIVSGEKIVKLLKGEALFSKEMNELEKILIDCKEIKKNSSISVRGDVPGDPLMEVSKEYWNVITLETLRRYVKLVGHIKKNHDKLMDTFELLGDIEALISIASYRENLDYCVPEIQEGDEINIVAEGIRNPLVDNCVENSINISRGIIITGCNMSGKSTFLRTLGTAQLLAQTIVSVPAESYSANIFKLITSIDIHDDINNKKSYYFVEIENIKKILDSEDNEYPVMAIVDEILNGTNPTDRVSASTSILQYLSKRKYLPIIATHDMELRDNMAGEYDFYYFTEDVEKETMVFDYKMRAGITDNKNAIKLLRILKYPDEILNKI